jgi:hypothetical protein
MAAPQIQLTVQQKAVLDICLKQEKGAKIFVYGPRRSGLSTMAAMFAKQRPTWKVRDLGRGPFDVETGRCPRIETVLNPTGTDSVAVFVTPALDNSDNLCISECAQHFDVVLQTFDHGATTIVQKFEVIVDK